MIFTKGVIDGITQPVNFNPFLFCQNPDIALYMVEMTGSPSVTFCFSGRPSVVSCTRKECMDLYKEEIRARKN